ncbi:MAG: CDP-alcohol phosphatidyltransferase family protein [Polyangiaceae bacterium]
MSQWIHIPGVVGLLIVGGYLFFATVSFSMRALAGSPHRDPDIEGRGDSALLGMRLRLLFSWALQPLWLVVRASGLPPMAITTLSVLLAIGAAVVASAGAFALAGFLYFASGLCDVLDGRLAREQGSASSQGAILDSVLDRYSDGAIFLGLAWFYRDSWVLLIALIALVGSLLVPYVRARAEGLKVTASVGLMARAERVVVLGSALVLSPLFSRLVGLPESWPPHLLTVIALGFIAAATQITSLHRLRFAMEQLGGSPDAKVKRHLAGTALSSVVATVTDFAAVLALVEVFGIAPWLATGLGAMAGAFINFMINRVLVFGSKDPAAPQAFRYSVVSASGALLNAGGVAAFLFQEAVDYRVAWWVVRGAVFLLWSFPLQRNYVYKPLHEAPPEPERSRPRLEPRSQPRAASYDSQDEASA